MVVARRPTQDPQASVGLTLRLRRLPPHPQDPRPGRPRGLGPPGSDQRRARSPLPVEQLSFHTGEKRAEGSPRESRSTCQRGHVTGSPLQEEGIGLFSSGGWSRRRLFRPEVSPRESRSTEDRGTGQRGHVTGSPLQWGAACIRKPESRSRGSGSAPARGDIPAAGPKRAAGPEARSPWGGACDASSARKSRHVSHVPRKTVERANVVT